MSSEMKSIDTPQDQYLSFEIAQELYAFSVTNVREILSFRGITFIPRMPEFMRGIINLREHVVPVLDLKMKFGMGETQANENTGIVVTELIHGDEIIVIGLLADSVNEVIEMSQDDIEPAPYIGSIMDSAFIRGMGKWKKDFVIVLNLEKILSIDELNLFSEGHGLQDIN